MSWSVKFGVLLIGLVLVVLLGGGTYLAIFDIPTPTTHIEKMLPDDRFPK